MTTPVEKPSLAGLEAKWSARWDRDGVFRFDRTKTRSQIFSIDTPPPTVSGSLHLGTVFGYVQTDAIARFRRMSGAEVFYPMGWDDNGLPTERRAQNYYGVRCDPTVAYDPTQRFSPVTGESSEQVPISRRRFVELCHDLTAQDEQKFEQLWHDVGLSVDWTLTYATIDDRCRRIAQEAFLRNLARGEAYAEEAPTLWDVDFRTAVAQAELEEREVPGAFHRLPFVGDEVRIEIETTRPELLPACVAMVVHPSDERYRHAVGKTVRTPLFGLPVPVHAHPLANPVKGTGAAMVCTFGDTTDVIWWRSLRLPTRTVVNRAGRLIEETPTWLHGRGAAAWADFAGRTVDEARARVLEVLRERGELLGAPRRISHPVKFYEKGDRPLEIVSSRQWYIRNGSHDPTLRARLLQRGQELDWHPLTMRTRYEHWVDGLNNDWLISRQRYFGVPFPVWYPVGLDGEPRWETPLVADSASLPVDPQIDAPAGYDESQRGKPGGFVGDPDVMDTWATSSLTPQIACGWVTDPDLFQRTFPMDLRPQGPEIIRTWLFATLLRSHLEHDRLPWTHTTINGWILDPDRKKMSKSLGNVITPNALLAEHGADAVRYWACSGSPGTDLAADVNQMKIGRRLATKILNASRFVLSVAQEAAAAPNFADVTETLDRAELARLARVVDEATRQFEAFRYDRALAAAEAFFWDFCDNYLELVKNRAYRDGPGAVSAQSCLSIVLDVLPRVFAPFLPFVTEEVWSWWRTGSVHRAPWPDTAALVAAFGDAHEAVLDVAGRLLSEIRRAKSVAKRSLRTPVRELVIHDVPDVLAVVDAIRADVAEAGSVQAIQLAEAAAPLVAVQLSEPV